MCAFIWKAFLWIFAICTFSLREILHRHSVWETVNAVCLEVFHLPKNWNYFWKWWVRKLVYYLRSGSEQQCWHRECKKWFVGQCSPEKGNKGSKIEEGEMSTQRSQWEWAAVCSHSETLQHKWYLSHSWSHLGVSRRGFYSPASGNQSSVVVSPCVRGQPSTWGSFQQVPTILHRRKMHLWMISILVLGILPNKGDGSWFQSILYTDEWQCKRTKILLNLGSVTSSSPAHIPAGTHPHL